jgi:hypothetical protein
MLAMGSQSWTVLLFESRSIVEFQKTKTAADNVDSFGVTADGPDGAKAAARAWLKSRGHKIRSANVCADKAKPRTLIVYVSAGSTAASRAFMAAQAASRKPGALPAKRTP